MITYVEGNLFESPAEVLVNTVNTQGVMGKGIALQFKQLFPEMFRAYRSLCERGEIEIGSLWLYRTEHKSVLCFPTKREWRLPSKLEYVEAGLRSLLRTYEIANIHSIALPALGCGNGGLDFESQVRPLMERYLSKMQARVFIYPHKSASQLPEHQSVADMSAWLRFRPEELAFPEVWDDIVQLLARRDHFRTFGRKTPFTAEVVDTPKAIRFRKEGVSCGLVTFDQLLDLWQGLRQFGVLRIMDAPSNLQRDASYVGPLMAQLPYIRPARVKGSFSTSSDFELYAEYALHVIPRSRPPESADQLQLLENL